MKSTKKFFAIVTLVMFMMTMIPMAAFGTPVTAFTRTSAATVVAGSGAYAFTATVQPATALAPADTITVTLPSGITIADAAAGQALNAATVNITAGGTSTIAATTWAAASNVVTITLGAGSVINTAIADIATITINTTVATTAGAAQNVALVTNKDTTPATVTVQVIPAGVNRFTTTLAQDKTTVDANNSDVISFTMFVYDQFYNPTPLGTKVYFASSRGDTDSFASTTYGYTGATDEAGAVIPNVYQVATTDATGKVVIKVKSLVAGTSTIGFSLRSDDVANVVRDNTIYDYLIGKTGVLLDGLQFVGTKTAEFKAQSASAVGFFDITRRNRTASTNIALVGTAAEITAGTEYGIGGLGWGAANGLDYYELSVKVTNSAGAPAADQDVQFSVDKVDATLSASTAKSDASGIAKIKIYANKAGTYEITYKTGSATAKTVKVTFETAQISKIVFKSTDNRTFAKGTKPSWKFELQDSNGNKLDIPAIGVGALVTSVDAVTQPSGSDLKHASFTFSQDADNMLIKMAATNSIDKIGDYKLRATLANGQYAEFSFKIAEQGAITGLKLKYPQTSLPMNTQIGTPTVTWVDANGVEKDASSSAFNTDGIQFSASDYTKLQIVGGNYINPATGAFTATNDKSLIGDVVITAYDNSNKLSASFTVTIGRQISTMVLTPPDSAAVGADASIGVKFVDLDGKDIAAGNVAVNVVNAYASSKPADATVAVSAVSTFSKDIKEKGVSSLTVNSNTAGEATIFVNVSVGGNNYTGTVKVTFGAAKTVVGAKAVTMFIGATGYVQDGAAKVTDVAPFIKDSRTFVAVRPIADAFGAEIGWNEATQTVTLTRADMTLTIVIGKAEITKLVGGVTSTITADVAAFIKDGRTVLPFRAIGEAFGATVNYDAATQAVSFTQ